ncbi:glycosyl transferase family 1 [Coprothermobacter proteolyticus DSM 5265]|uniref:Glycosyl transferase, group 1 family protein n=1 Tax=Coprothermobacter proteolyticus (strain ATCC 35245 / DSM 5265 / OCM 4 / BT) TaxID=309798 RepID=B5Y7P7_COPPD|nr:glycosyltransferase [Coprothermobacter proteolyticus]ACI16973.1 glycosyl transferase family 1 [Coprothermobacter proteolyticus DSM 5265]
MKTIHDPLLNLRQFHIALFLPNLGGGGAERVFANLGNAFVEKGMVVDFVLGKAEGPNLSQIDRRINVVDLGTNTVYGWLRPMKSYLKERHPELVLSALHHANLTALWANMLSGKKTRIIVSVHGTMSHDIGKSKKKLAKAIPLLVRAFYPKADKIICVSNGVAQELINKYHLPKNKVQVIYNPVVTEDMFKKAEEPLDHPWFQPGQPPVILGVGRLTAAKDFETLIKAFALVRKKTEARLMILGEGSERAKLEQLVKQLGLQNDVCMPGFVDNPYKYMKHSSVFVLSSRWEGLPTVLIEALALGLPVVSTDCPSGPAEILEGGKWGKLVPVGSPEALANAILEALNDERGKGAERAKEFSLDRIVDQYVALIKELEQ